MQTVDKRERIADSRLQALRIADSRHVGWTACLRDAWLAGGGVCGARLRGGDASPALYARLKGITEARTPACVCVCVCECTVMCLSLWL